jgi:hypothetical protein
MRHEINLIEANTRPAKLETTPLHYGHEDLEPIMRDAVELEFSPYDLTRGRITRRN